MLDSVRCLEFASFEGSFPVGELDSIIFLLSNGMVGGNYDEWALWSGVVPQMCDNFYS